MERIKTFVDNETIIDAATLNAMQDNAQGNLGYIPFDKSKVKTGYQNGDTLSADEVFSTSAMPIYLGKQHYESTDNRVNTIDEEADNDSYPTALAVYNQIIKMEQVAKRVNVINESSDDAHYPTAKAVYDLFNSIVNGDEVSY